MKISVIIHKLIISSLMAFIISLSYAQTNIKVKARSNAIFGKLHNFSASYKKSFDVKKNKKNLFKSKHRKQSVFGFLFKKHKTSTSYKGSKPLSSASKAGHDNINSLDKKNTYKNPNYLPSGPKKHLYTAPPIKRLKMDATYAKHCIDIIHKYEKIYRIPKNTLHAISLVESGTSCQGCPATIRYPWPWTIASATAGVPGMQFKSKQEARQFLRNLLFQGNKNIDVGCMQINMLYHKHAFASLDDLLDPHKNISYAAKHLHDKYKQSNSWNKAVALYHSSCKTKGPQYLMRVMAAKKEISKHPMLIAQSKLKQVCLANKGTR